MRAGILWAAMWTLSSAVGLAGGPFVAPAEGPVPFRRDRVPLDVETMTALSRQLTQLSRTLGNDKATDRRSAAKTLALALALDPVNREARDLINDRIAGKPTEVAESDQNEKFRNGIRQLLAWLETEEAGNDGQSLALCLGDVAAALDPLRSRPSDRKEHSRVWRGWVPDLKAFQENASEAALPPTVPDATVLVPTFARKEAAVMTPLLTGGEAGVPAAWQIVEVSMKASMEKEEAEGGPQPFHFYFRGDEPNESVYKTNEAVTSALKSMGETLPPGGKVALSLGKKSYSYKQNGEAVSAPAAVLMDAAMSGREPIATVIGVVDASGALTLPPRAWDRLRILSDGPGGRLVVPRDAEPLLNSMLAIEDAAFFLKYEVVFAGSVKELVERAAKSGDDPLAEASARFAEIRSKQGATTIGQYVTNRFIRQRLAEISQIYPDHVSARLLEVQGSGKRPTSLPRSVLASEARRIIEPINPVLRNYNRADADIEQNEKLYEACRLRFEALERYTDMRDRDLLAKSKDILSGLRTLSKSRSRESYSDYEKQMAAIKNLRTAYAAYRHELAAAAGDEDTSGIETE